MSKSLTILSLALLALLMSGAAMAAPTNQPAPNVQAVSAVQPAVVQTVEAIPAPAVAQTQAPLFRLLSQGAASPEPCGTRYCPPDEYCCNAQLSMCAKIGQLCPL